ncbi:ribokinase [Neobacillus sp. YIM B06451]|uniref:ribokinase n=1 Tax=Neobacillus sp. YIM B06451 TaxID=3070994 RepID=UPI00292D4C7D|nr:ribokinase [Neobacillus sp. YIM B06451]
MEKKPKITVVGSINMDLVSITDQVPQKGETLMGKKFFMNPGGKGANQAVAAARLGAHVRMIGCVGDDSFGESLTQHLHKEGIDITHVEPVSDSTGTATIIVSDNDNSIIVVPGANLHVTADFVESKRDIIADSDILILQLEIPLEGVKKAVAIASENGVETILNPAPICDLPDEILEQVTYLTPNEHEYASLIKNMDQNTIQEKVIMTKGSKGVAFFQQGIQLEIPAFKVNTVDTTGAGDSFNGGLAFALGTGLSLEQACKYGNAVGALSTMKLGAQKGMPKKEEVEAILKNEAVIS